MATLGLRSSTALVLEKARRGEGAWILTLNGELVAKALMDDAYLELFEQADWITPDGAPIVAWLRLVQRRRGERPSAERVTGVDLVGGLLDTLKAPGSPRIGIIGGTDLREGLARLGFPSENVGFLWDGPVDPGDKAQVETFAGACRTGGVGLLILCVGADKYGLVPALRARLPRTVILTAGGAMDLLTGLKARAPLWMQSRGLEWLWRLALEPRRLARRYLLLYPWGLLLFFKKTSSISKRSVGFVGLDQREGRSEQDEHVEPK